MWWVKTNSSGEEGGGFQNRDTGKTSFDNDFGPDYGVDYARFSDPPDIVRDLRIKELLSQKLKDFEESLSGFEMKVRNGFVLLKGEITNSEIKDQLIDTVFATDGVKEVINNLRVNTDHHESHH